MLPREDEVKKMRKRTIGLGLAIIALIAGIWSFGYLIETVDAGQIVAKQSALSGKVEFWKDAGPKAQLFGKITAYQKSSQYWFSAKKEQGGRDDQAMKMRFNDGGHGTLSGSVRYDLPVDDAHLMLIHTTFGSQEAIERTLIRTVMEKATYFSGPLMSSTQSFAERRNELIGFIEDQAAKGIYRSASKCEKQPDPVTKVEKTVCIVELEHDTGGQIKRVDQSPLEKYGITLTNLSINDLDYDNDVKGQIQAQQKAIAQVQTAAAEARQAEQRAITVAKQGEADAAKAKWEQEVVKAKAVTQAEQQKEVARLDKEAAEFTKQKDILLGEGEAARKKLIMAADGALQPKIAAWTEVNKFYAAELGKQSWVPQIQMGNGDGVGMSGATSLVSMLMAKTAKDLALDMDVRGGRGGGGKK